MITHAWKAQQRLHAQFHHLSYRTRPQIAVVAVARELVGFLWAVAREDEPAASICMSAWSAVWRRAAMCEHARRRYAGRAGLSTGIPESRMSQLPTHPLLAAPSRVTGDLASGAGC